MANLLKNAGDVGKKLADFSKYKLLPASKIVIAKVRPPVVKSSKYVARKIGPHIRKGSENVIAIIYPSIERSSQAVMSKIQPHFDRTSNFFRSRTVSTVPTEKNSLVNSDEDGDGQHPQEEEDKYRERYIPITRMSVMRHLMVKEDFLTNQEKKIFEDFALALDAVIVNTYSGVLQELKRLFDPINPDKDTIQTRKLNPRERQESEFWLLQRLEDVMERANFRELPQSVVQHALKEHEVMEGVRVAVDTDKYDVLKFWALGREVIPIEIPWYKALLAKYQKPKDQPRPKQYYKRVVVAIRFKRDQKLMLKSFKEIPVNSLEMMLPDGKIRIGKWDKGVIATSLTLAMAGVLAKTVTVMAAMQVDWMLIVTALTGMTAVRGITMYKNKRNKYLADISRLLYFKNIANNRGLLALMVDRAEDESFKEALAVYTFLLANRPRSMLQMRSLEMPPNELGGLTAAEVESKVEDWIYEVTGTRVMVDSSECIALLQRLGLLSQVDGKLHVLPLEAALRNLPQQPQSLVARARESDISEGYDRDEFLETEEQYEQEEKVQRRVGWF